MNYLKMGIGAYNNCYDFCFKIILYEEVITAIDASACNNSNNWSGNGFSELLKDPEIKGDMQKKYLSIIEKSGLRMLNTISGIIDISQIEAGTISINLSIMNINNQMDEIYNLFKPEAEKKQIEFKLSKALQDKDANIKTDKAKFNSILNNLIKNAIKYTENGLIEIGYILDEKDKSIKFFIKDTGIGIPSYRQSAIFKRFVQADIEDKMARQGAGLGLTIAKAYVDMLEGQIWVESQENVGSAFYFTLQFVKGQVSKITNPPYINESRSETNNFKILIAEDDDASCQFLEILLSSYGKEIIKTKGGKEAVEACYNNPDVDLIFMDIQMPNMNGFEATRKIREFNKDVIIIAQTAFALTGDKEKYLENGCNDYISKPINKSEFDALMHKYIKSQFTINKRK